MPVTTSGQVVQTLESVNILPGGAVDVTIRFQVSGFSDMCKTFSISQAEALPYWGSLPTPDTIRWEDLCNLLYGILTARGDLTGVIT